MTEPVVDGPPGNDDSAASEAARATRRRGSRGGRNRPRPAGERAEGGAGTDGEADTGTGSGADTDADSGQEAGDRTSSARPVTATGAGADASATSTRSGGASRAAAGPAPALDDDGRAPAPAPGGGDAAAASTRTAGTGSSRTAPGAGPSAAGSGSATPDPGPIAPASGPAAAAAGKPKIGDTRPAPAGGDEAGADATADGLPAAKSGNRRRRGGRGGRSGSGSGSAASADAGDDGSGGSGGEPRPGARGGSGRGDGRGGRGGSGGGNSGSGGDRRSTKAPQPIEALLASEPLALDDDEMRRRGGRERKGRPVGRYLMAVSVGPKATQIAVLEGRNLIEHYVSRPADDVSQIHGNIYIGRVQNVLPGMEAAFIDISTPKNAVLYRSDVSHDPDDVDGKVKQQARIEDILRPKQTIICQVTKNPIAHKGARLTQEVSLPGRFVVLIPNSTTYGISKRLEDSERKRLRGILDKVRPKGHGLIVRTAASGVSADEIERDVLQLSAQWQQIEALAAKTQAPALLYREPDMAVRVIREELNDDYRAIVIDDPTLFGEIRNYVGAISPALADRVQLYDTTVEPLSIYERHHVHEQIHRALDRKVWLPSGGSLIIEHTEALTVIDVNTGKNVGSSNLEETVFRNNLEAAIEIAKQLRLRDIGGIIVIDFIDMEIDKNRKAVIKAFREALARDKTRTQAFDITDLGLVEMTRKRIGEGLLESFATPCPECEGRGVTLDQDLII